MADVEPSEFLQNIRELGEKREREDEERVRRLEAQILQDKSEREARRAERARSISPQKKASPQTPQSQANTPPSATLPRSPRSLTKMNDVEGAQGPERTNSRPSSSANGNAPDETARRSPLARSSTTMTSPTSDSSQPQSGSAASLGRSGTLTWNRRPNSGERSRPLSGLGRNTPSLRSPSKLSDDTRDKEQEQEPSRSAIAQSLSSKDPSWFRQTADRGIGSAAYRRSQEDSISDDGFVSGRRGLPGLSRESTTEPEVDTASPQGSVRSTSPSRADSVKGGLRNNGFSSQTQSTDSPPEGKNVLSTNKAPKFELPRRDGGNSAQEDETPHNRSNSIMSPSQGRIAAERPASPTKGMGGFVQSAMMKRSDSVNKRWSAQAGAGGLSRQNSTASNRSGYGGSTLAGSNSLPAIDGRPISLSRGNSTEPTSRPTSSHSNISDLAIRGDMSIRDLDGFVKPTLPLHSRGKTASEAGATDAMTSPPLSPSKRYSPTKSSWLESALNKPESPKPKPTISQQPGWMTELSKARQQRNSANSDEKRGSDKDIASFDALLNSRPGSPSKRQQASSEPAASIDPEVGTRSESLVRESPPAVAQTDEQPSAETLNMSSEQVTTVSNSKSAASKEAATPPPTKPKPADSPSFSKPKLTSRSDQVTPKPKPDTPPKKDFRSTLKSRQPPADLAQNNEPEFKNVFGKLRKAETKNYVAPDELKSNILRGKAGLATTGGPQKREKRDELKEDLLKQKEAMKQKATEETTSGRKNSISNKPIAEIPEALQRRNKLSRSGSSVGTLPSSSATRSPSKVKSPPPEQLPDSATDTKPVEKPVSPPPVAETAGRLAGGTSKLAARFNPGLANVLARGPSPMSNESGAAKTTSSDSLPGREALAGGESHESGSSAPLTHMTKSRARGPKRRAPKSAPDGSEQTTSISEPVASLDKDSNAPSRFPPLNPPPEMRVSSAVPTAQLVKTKDVLPSSPTSADRQSSELAPVADANTLINPRPIPESTKSATPKKSPLAELVAAKARGEKSDELQPTDNGSKTTVLNSDLEDKGITSSMTSAQRDSNSTKAKTIGPSSPVKSVELPKPLNQPSREADASGTPSVKGFATRWNNQETESSTPTNRARSPIRLPTKDDEQKAMRAAGLIRSTSPTKQPVGLGLNGVLESNSASVTRSTEDSERVTRNKYPMSPPASTDLSKPSAPAPTTTSKPSNSGAGVTPSTSRQSSSNVPPQSPIPDTTAAADTFKSFFGTCPSHSEPLDVDTASILSSQPLIPKLRTARTSIHALDPSTGKLAPLPQQEQHILYTGELYLCTHTSTDEKGAKSTESYFWIGDDVSEAAANDSILFARKKAKEESGKLVQARQSKEPAGLIQALGGILITRRGTRADPLAPRGTASGSYMLCARRHLSHMVFDEVPLSRGSFCSGFTFVILAPKKTILWKGAGSGVEEYATAKLTAMDLPGAGGDVLDVDEGKEPRELHQVFFTAGDETKNVARSAEHWKQKRRCEDRYRVRLFRVEEQHQQGSSDRVGRPGSSSSGTGAGLMGSWMGSWSNSFGRRPSQQHEEAVEKEESPARSTSPVKQRPGTPKLVGAGASREGGKAKITEVVPFCQKDLVDAKEAIWVLDAFFEVYVILGPQSDKHASVLPTALLFAQDYSILAASLEDRPFVPVGNVLMPGFFPRDLKAVFRGWRDEVTESFKEGRKEGKKVLGLGAAIAAVRQ